MTSPLIGLVEQHGTTVCADATKTSADLLLEQGPDIYPVSRQVGDYLFVNFWEPDGLRALMARHRVDACNAIS